VIGGVVVLGSLTLLIWWRLRNKKKSIDDEGGGSEPLEVDELAMRAGQDEAAQGD
jgi:hypothetical protein